MKTRPQIKTKEYEEKSCWGKRIEQWWKQWKCYGTDAECEALSHRRTSLQRNRMSLWKPSPCLQIQENKAKWIDSLESIQRWLLYEITNTVSSHCKISRKRNPIVDEALLRAIYHSWHSSHQRGHASLSHTSYIRLKSKFNTLLKLII